MCRRRRKGLKVRDQSRDAAAQVSQASGGCDGFREPGVEALLKGREFTLGDALAVSCL